jgi:hypothetical protein
MLSSRVLVPAFSSTNSSTSLALWIAHSTWLCEEPACTNHKPAAVLLQGICS